MGTLNHLMILLLLWILETVLFWKLILFLVQYIYTIPFFDKSNEEPSHCSDGMVDDAGYTREKNSDLDLRDYRKRRIWI